MDKKKTMNQNPQKTIDTSDINNNLDLDDFDDEMGLEYEETDEGSLGGQVTSDDQLQGNQTNLTPAKSRKGKQGFGSDKFDPQRQREIAAEGGRAAHAQGKAHEWDSAEAKAAGRIGGSR